MEAPEKDNELKVISAFGLKVVPLIRTLAPDVAVVAYSLPTASGLMPVALAALLAGLIL